MIKNWLFILIAAIVAIAGLWMYYTFRHPADVIPQGDSTEKIAWIGLAVAVVSLLTAVVGLIQKIIELVSVQKNHK